MRARLTRVLAALAVVVFATLWDSGHPPAGSHTSDGSSHQLAIEPAPSPAWPAAVTAVKAAPTVVNAPSHTQWRRHLLLASGPAADRRQAPVLADDAIRRPVFPLLI